MRKTPTQRLREKVKLLEAENQRLRNENGAWKMRQDFLHEKIDQIAREFRKDALFIARLEVREDMKRLGEENMKLVHRIAVLEAGPKL